MQRAKEKHAWKFDVSVGPQNAGVGGFISRKLSKMSTFRLGVRIGSAAMDVDLMCVRKINQETSVGFSVSLGVRGAHWKFRFTHNGQKFLLPVLISPRLTPTLALCAVTIPDDRHRGDEDLRRRADRDAEGGGEAESAEGEIRGEGEGEQSGSPRTRRRCCSTKRRRARRGSARTAGS